MHVEPPPLSLTSSRAPPTRGNWNYLWLIKISCLWVCRGDAWGGGGAVFTAFNEAQSPSGINWCAQLVRAA
jgi:hypothetical protein